MTELPPMSTGDKIATTVVLVLLLVGIGVWWLLVGLLVWLLTGWHP